MYLTNVNLMLWVNASLIDKSLYRTPGLHIVSEYRHPHPLHEMV